MSERREPVKSGDRIEWRWRGKTRELLVSQVDFQRRMFFGKDPRTGKTWQVEEGYVTAIHRGGEAA